MFEQVLKIFGNEVHVMSENVVSVKYFELQDLSNVGYNGDYYLEWPTRSSSTSSWERNPVQASLRHRFLEAGHRGTFQITSNHTKNKPIEIDYGFKASSKNI